MNTDVIVVREALSGKSAKDIKKALKREDISMKTKDVVARLATYGFIYDDATEKWIQVIPFDPFTVEEVAKLKQLVALEQAVEEQHIEEAVAKLSSENRKSKTFYIDQDLALQVKRYAEENGVRLADFVEIALIDALKKYQ